MIRFALTLFPVALLAADAPGWLKELATSSLPAYEAKVPAAVLLNEESVTLDATGKQLRSTRYALKVLTKDGAGDANNAIYYNTDTGKVREIKAWLISPSGKVKEYGKAETTEANINQYLYEEMKYRYIDARADADPGAVFGFESTVEEKTIFTQFTHTFQDTLPALRSAFVLNLPAGWKAEGQVFRGLGTEKVEPEVSGSTYRWQLTRLAPFDPESNAPSRALLPRLVVSTFPPGGSGDGHFQTWKDVAAWDLQFYKASATLTPELTAKANEVTAQAKTLWDKVSALAAHAQSIRYEEVAINLSRGGGYTPRPAAQVLAKGYGDCKDKANYLHTLLKAINVNSYMVSIYSGDPRRTRQEWPSPFQFNHAILAIQIPADAPAAAQAPAAFDFPGLGRLMMFDPTDYHVPLGYVPDHEQDSWALLAAPAHGDLFKTPSTTPNQNHLERATSLKLSAEGGIVASIADRSTGQSAFRNRRLVRSLAGDDYQKAIERTVSRAVPGAAFAKIEPKDDTAAHNFDLRIDFSAPAYGRSMQGRLLMVKPLVLSYSGLPDVSNPKRTQPLILKPASFRERVELEIPAGFAVDEMPDSGAFETAYGKYKAAFRSEGGKVIVEREIELRSAWVPVEQFKSLRDFIGKIGGTEQSPVVLIRK